MIFFKKHKQLSIENMFIFGPSGCRKLSTINYLCNLYGFTKIDEKNFVDNLDNWEETSSNQNTKQSSKAFILKSALVMSMNNIFR